MRAATRVRRLIEREAKDLVAESIRATGTWAGADVRGPGPDAPLAPHLVRLGGPRNEGRLSLSLNVDWCAQVYELGRTLVDGQLVVEVVDDNLVLACPVAPRAERPT